MSLHLRKVLVVTRSGDFEAKALGAEVAAFLSGSDVEVMVCQHRPEAYDADVFGQPGPDLIMVLGGDGTFIGVARRMLHLEAPFVGVNLGRVGFLAQLDRAGWKPWLAENLKGNVRSVRRMALAYDVVRQGNVVRSGLAVNDVVVGRGELARLVRLGFSYGGRRLASVRADGLIVSTPTGSTAYGASAGGPLVHADLFSYCVTAVCPFLSGFKPLVLPVGEECAVCVEEAATGVSLTEDGQFSFPLESGDEVRVRRSPRDLLVADMGQGAYFDKLKNHGLLTER
ncbi:NAD(+)/NADH kinase [Pseudodesulfovibrio sp. F-1]|uniref:NAD kinase n=1 Tax=Pseudodesulfovibrio alkaliphilus TaxID=2661613 RepID=A0A7K1KJI1_9BACT|nr:NAD(+)/NADH kinase [Pseudodesulfovibrio alkaliphilus]MUM76042.1 NAD(+)/NADH kinase [Pseudodesulfovibrio alkaliphilus]